MGFDRLLAHDLGRIILVNLAETGRSRLLPDAVKKEVLGRLAAGLAALGTAPDPADTLRAVAGVLFARPLEVQAMGTEQPLGDTTIAAVVAFDKIRGLLDKIAWRRRDLRPLVDAIVDIDAPDATVAKAASLINTHAARMSTLSLSDWGTIFWAAPSSEIDRLLAQCATGASPTAVARHLRDALGLVHMNFDLADHNRHLFLFRATTSLDDIGASEDFVAARPTTLDGWDNRRFSQRRLAPMPAFPGFGMTVDIGDYTVAPGAAEIVCSVLPLKFFDCSYLGAVDGSAFGTDADFLDLIRDGRDLNDLVDYLTREAA